jgi:putative heme-binding domain-containing protein
MRRLPALFIALFCLIQPLVADEAIDALVGVLKESTDAQLDLDILRGLRDSLTSVRKTDAPKDWDSVAQRLGRSGNAEVRELAKLLSLKFGSQSSLDEYRKAVRSPKVAVADRRKALESLVSARDPQFVDVGLKLLAEPALRTDAIRALGKFNDARIPPALLQRYPALKPIPGRRAVLNVLVSRPAYAVALLAGVKTKTVPATDLTADLVRQLRNFKDQAINQKVRQLWGVVRESPAEKKQEIARYKKLLTVKSNRDDPRKGRPLFNLICGQCHTMFGEGGIVGPDITGANRSELDYLLHNILDPNAEIPNDYRTTNIDTKDERSLTGVVVRQDARSITIVTAAETATIARSDIAFMKESELSMMPEGLLQPLNEQQVRDLIAYLQSPRQVALP